MKKILATATTPQLIKDEMYDDISMFVDSVYDCIWDEYEDDEDILDMLDELMRSVLADISEEYALRYRGS